MDFDAIVRLRTGEYVSKALVDGILRRVQRLRRVWPVAFLDLINLCRTPKGKELDESVRVTLFQEQLITNWNAPEVRASVRTVLLAAVAGDGLSTTLRSPYELKERRSTRR